MLWLSGRSGVEKAGYHPSAVAGRIDPHCSRSVTDRYPEWLSVNTHCGAVRRPVGTVGVDEVPHWSFGSSYSDAASPPRDDIRRF